MAFLNKKQWIILCLIAAGISLLVFLYINKTPDYLSVHIIDVGQGDSILVITPEGKTLLIDAGEPDQGDYVTSYIKKRFIKTIDVLVGTHPHSDHIGGLKNIIDNFHIGKFYMPPVSHTSSAFEQVLLSAREKNLKITVPNKDLVIDLDNETRLFFLSPLRDYSENLNLWSIVIKMEHKEKSFLFAGDAEYPTESDILNAFDKSFLRSHFLKVAHHGSNTSSSAEFLKAVRPDAAVISCGLNNEYGHPHDEVIKRLIGKNAAVYRTDYQGTIVFKSDGYKIWSHSKPYY